MAKPHRMFIMTVAALLSIFEPQLGPSTRVLFDWPTEAIFIAIGLWVVALGATVTTFSRAWRALRFVNKT
jgi:hypothetical protein